ncbi:MAG: DUF433 domain-containing protein [Chloroflexota bacterium]
MVKEAFRYQDRIIYDPAILVGKPVVKGTRIPVELVLAKLAANPDLAELFADYPRLTREDVQACLEFAATLVEEKGHPPQAQPVQA